MQQYPLVASSLLGFVFLSGCALQTTATDTTPQTLSIAGRSMGATIPIVGATITLYAAGTTGYGSAPTVIGQGTTVTDSNGYFTLTRTATCTDPQQLYIVSSGGTQAGVANSKIVTLAAMGTCSTITSGTWVIINEATTVSAAAALSGFALYDGSSINIGTSSTNISGLQHAFANATNLAALGGYARTSTIAGNGVVPNKVINMLANALVACVDSNGSTAACSNIAVAPSGVTTPTNAWQIALTWARYPGYNVTNVFNNQAPPYFFQPYLASAPPDLSIAIAYSAGYQSDGVTAATAPADVKADGNGNIWLAGMTGVPLAELGADGTVLSPSGGYGNAALKSATLSSIAIDSSSATIWAASNGGSVFSYAPSSSTTAQYILPSSITHNSGTVASVSTNAQSIAIDAQGDIWYGTKTATATATNLMGEIKNNISSYSVITAYSGNPLLPTSSLGSTYLAINNASGQTSSNAIVTNDGTVSDIDYILFPYTGAVAAASNTMSATGQAMAFDASGNLWVPSTGTTANSGQLCLYTQLSTVACHKVPNVPGQNGLYKPVAVAVDGIGRVFTASNGNVGAIVEYDTSLGFLTTSAGNGYAPVDSSGAAVLAANALNNMTIDSAGAIWIANSTSSSSPVVQLLGPAAPAVAPPSQGKYAVRP